MSDDSAHAAALLRVLVEESHDQAIFVVDADGRVATWNAGAERLFGHRADQIVGRDVSVLGLGRDRLDPARRTESEGPWPRADGGELWARVIVTPADGRFVVIARDLGERRRADDAIRRGEENLAVTLRSIGDALIATDREGRVTLMNPVAEELTGWRLDEASSQPLERVFVIVNEETHAAVESPVVKALRDGTVVGLANHTLLIARDGTERPIADSAAPIRARDGAISGVVLIFRDQTEERAAQRALEESEERLRLLIEGVHEYAIYMLTPTGEIASWNEGAARIKGYPASEILGTSYARFFPPEDLAGKKPARLLEQAAAHGVAEDEGWRVRKDGTVFWASAVIRALYDERGALRGFAKVTRDLTERRAAEERARALIAEQAAREAAEASAARLADSERRAREAAARLDAVLGGVTDGITMQDRGGAIVYANLPAARLSGFATADEMMRTPLAAFPRRFEIADVDGAPFPYAQLPGRVALETGHAATTLLQVRERATGSTWWTEIHAEPVRDGDHVAGVVNIWRDVTEQRRREASLRFVADAGEVLASSLDYEDTLARLAHLVVPALADWCTVDIVVDGAIKSLAVAHADPNKVALARSVSERWPPDRTTGGTARVIETGAPLLVPEIGEDLLERSAQDAEHLTVLRMLGLRSGMVIPLAARGQIFGALSFIAAESGRRYDERDLAFAVDLGRRAAIAVDNARLYREAREAVRVRDDFLSIAGHELRTPLTAMLLQVHGMVRLGERGQLTDDPARLQQRLGKLADQGARIEHLVDDLLDVSRIAAGRLTLDRRRVDLADVVAQVVERFRDDAAAAEAPIAVVTDGDVTGSWDPHRLDQVVTNLVANALKYGRGTPIEVRLARAPSAARLTVRDGGIGIPPEDQARIFGRFERAVSDRNYGGLGLGLWITGQIVEAHGGRIEVSSTPGQGAEFIVELPFDPP